MIKQAMKVRTLFIFLLLIASQTIVSAAVRLPKILGNNMVLQREKPLPIWGWASAGEQVTVTFAGQQKTAKADAEGTWKVTFDPLKANANPQEMTIAGSDTITLSNLLIGEVWLCSGQSNMEYTMKLHPKYARPAKGIDSAAVALTKTHPGIRIFKVEKERSNPDVTSTGWNECSGEALEAFSAIGFYFAKDIQRELNVPIGVISSSWGGSRIEPWTPAEAYKALPAFAAALQSEPFKVDEVEPGKNYRSMIKPLALRGVLWYQGESNCMQHDGMRYADKMQALIEGWRKEWGNEQLPFYSVMIAPFLYTKRNDRLPHTPETLPEFWEAQTQSLKIPYTGMAVVTDLVDDLGDIHPSYKWEIGRRLALIALAKDYDKKVVSQGPVFKEMKVKKRQAILSFDHADGLKSLDGKPLSWFSIAGADGQFKPAIAKIKGDKVIVYAEGVRKPAIVRFAWNETAMPNLSNKAGLPAVPFCTDALEWKYTKNSFIGAE
ncbi:sialate O-acetylesterase [Pontibacter beigongshangensis]|uniref:sialate O-acetylesterase n=1 Tax=Pontibacter beigongshangensis TaxID=2574733 RepID=UPI0019D60F52|nr:sialate O-acetylesterase [Pontibacter beigongshangensis]